MCNRPITIVIPDLPSLSNTFLLQVAVILFLTFMIAEMVGAFVGDSLSLLGDAWSMLVDVCSYLCNIYGEWCRDHYGYLSPRRRLLLDVIIPSVSVLSLLLVTTYILIDALQVLRHPPKHDDVNVEFLYAFSMANLVVDSICGALFYYSREEAFVDHIPMISLNTSISTDSSPENSDTEKEFGELGMELEDSDFALPSVATIKNKSETPQIAAASSTSNTFSYQLNQLLFSHIFHSGAQREGGGAGNTREIRAGEHSYNGLNSVELSDLNNGESKSSQRSRNVDRRNRARELDWSNPRSANRGIDRRETSLGVGKTPHRNLNMLSAFVHIVGDTLRSSAVFLAAAVSSISGIDGDICDAWAALVVAVSIIFLCVPLIRDVWGAARDVQRSFFDNDESIIYGRLAVDDEEE